LHVPKDELKALQLIAKKHFSKVDIGKCNNDFFLCTCGFGFDAKIAHAFSLLKTRGIKSYLKSVLQNFNQYKSQTYTITSENYNNSKTAFILSVANAAQYGNHTIIAPQASIKDGELDLCSIPKPTILQSILLGIFIGLKKIDLYPGYEMQKITQCSITSENNFYVHIDGEPISKTNKIEIQILPQAIEVIHQENCFI